MGGVKLKKKKSASFEVVEEDTKVQKIRRGLQTRYKIPAIRCPFEESKFPQLPYDITSISGEELSKLSGHFSAYAEYLQEVATTHEVQFLFDEDDSKIKDCLERLALADDKSMPKHVKDDKAFVEEDARARRSKKMETKATFKILNAKLESIDRHIKTLSREQTRREIRV